MPKVIDHPGQLLDVGAEIAEEFANLELREALQRLSDNLEEDHAVYFQEQRSPDGQPWASLAPRTVRQKGHSQILVESGALRESLTSLAGGAVRNIEVSPGQGELEWGTDIGYSVELTEGRHNMPARPHVGITEDRIQQFVEDVADQIVEKLKEGNR